MEVTRPGIEFGNEKDKDHLFKATFHQAAVGMALLSPCGAWISVNQKLCDIVGYPESEILKLTFQDITHPEDLDKDLTLVGRVLAGNLDTYSLEKRYIRKDQSITWINLTVSLIRGDNNQPKYFISVIEDINTRKMMEASLNFLRENLEQDVALRTQDLQQANEALKSEIKKKEVAKLHLRKFFQLSADITVVFNTDRTVRSINDSFSRILGYTIEEVVNKTLSSFIPEEDRIKSQKNHDTLFKGMPVINFENRFTCKDGSIRTLSWSYVLIREIDSIFAVARDITEIKAQEKLISDQKQKMANVSKMNSLGRMASGIAHEINNPMMTIYGQVYLLKKHLGEPLVSREYVSDGLTKIELVAERVKSIISGLKSFSRDGSLDSAEDTDLLVVVSEAIAMCRVSLLKKSITLQLCGAEGQIKVYCRPTQLSQVVLNLIENSVDAIDEKQPSPWIRIEIQAQSVDGFVYLNIVDSGIGLSDGAKENIFHPFFTTKPVGKGTGLGLSISKSIMLSNQGDLFLNENAPNTTFVIKVPISKK